jgi:hypothetical protein
MLEVVNFYQRPAIFCELVFSNRYICLLAVTLTIQVLLEMGGLCNSIGSNQVYYEISVEQLIVGKLQVKKKDSFLAVIIVTQKYEDNFEVLSSVVDPDPHGSALVLVGWVRIRI